jgi:ABC-type phosphate/phosphonate transport system substrate-binding protein
MSLHRRACTALLLCAAFWQTASAAEFKIGIEPSYPRDQAQEIYKPLLDYLNKATGHTFVLVVPRNYHFLWRDLRQNAPLDFAFEEAHFVDYRVKRHGFEPLVKTTEPTNYTLLAQPELAENGTNGLVGRRIACMPSPSLGFALVAEMYKNPVAQPDIRSEAASWRDGVEMVFAGEADAAMVQTYIADLYPNLVAVSKTRDFPGRALSAAQGVDPAARQAVKDAMLKLHEDTTLFDVLTEIGTSQFVETNAAEYAGAEQMLSGFFGYTPPPSSPPAAPAAPAAAPAEPPSGP